MRTIKYRAWNKETKEMREWDISSMTNWLLYPETCELMQFTGLSDRNGKEIYEGDIIDFGGLKPILIEWVENGFHSKMYSSEPIKLTQEGMGTFGEVIGNIYSNPELLTKNI